MVEHDPTTPSENPAAVQAWIDANLAKFGLTANQLTVRGTGTALQIEVRGVPLREVEKSTADLGQELSRQPFIETIRGSFNSEPRPSPAPAPADQHNGRQNHREAVPPSVMGILKLLFASTDEPLTRAELTKKLGISQASVAMGVKRLLEQELIEQAGERPQLGRGSNPATYRLTSQGLALGPNFTAAAQPHQPRRPPEEKGTQYRKILRYLYEHRSRTCVTSELANHLDRTRASTQEILSSLVQMSMVHVAGKSKVPRGPGESMYKLTEAGLHFGPNFYAIAAPV
jgi:predicted ArsR family transcriptional regulator